MAKSLTRKELYELIWKKPVMQIAKEYGLSDRGLVKYARNIIFLRRQEDIGLKFSQGKK